MAANGSIGRDGATGQDGQLRLVNQLEPLISDTPTQTLTLQEFASRPITLSRNLWETRTGGKCLASGRLGGEPHLSSLCWPRRRGGRPKLAGRKTRQLVFLMQR